MARSNNKKTETTNATPVVEDAPAEAPKTKRNRKAEAAVEAAPVVPEEAPVAATKTKRNRKAAEAEAAVPETPAVTAASVAAVEETPVTKPKRGRKAAAAAAEQEQEQEQPSPVAESPSKTPAKRRIITPDVLDAEIVEFINGIESEIKRVELSDNKSGSKYLKTLVKKARDIQKHAQKVKGKRAKPTPAASAGDTPSKPKAPSGIQKPVAITPEFAKFLGVSADTLVSRVDGSKAINTYIKDNGLNSGKNINPDKTLSKLLAFTPTEENPLTYNSMMKVMQRLFVKATPAVA